MFEMFFKLVKYCFIAGVSIYCLGLIISLFSGDGSDTQTKPPIAQTKTNALLNGTPKASAGKITGEWWDTKWKHSLKIYKKSDKFFMDDYWGTSEMEKCSPPKSYMKSSDWTTFTQVDRIGKPDIKYAIKHSDGKLYFHLNCEFGPCGLSRVMERVK